MAAVSTFPSPGEIATLLGSSPNTSEPAVDLGTLEDYHRDWPYPKSLDSWEGFIFADLQEQLGWAHFNHEEFEEALRVWRDCPWQTVTSGERQALAHLLQAAYEEQSLVLGPPVSDILLYGRIQLGKVLATLDDSASTLTHAGSGVGYVVESRLVQADGLYCLRFEFDLQTLFYLSFLPADVHFKLQTARTSFQIGEHKDAASWLLRAAFQAYQCDLGPEAVSFLQKALQLDPENEVVKTSLTNLQVKGESATFFSRVIVERTLFQPDPLKRCEKRPDPLPPPQNIWLEHNWLNTLPCRAKSVDVDKRLVSLGSFALNQAKQLHQRVEQDSQAWPLLLPTSWKFPSKLDESKIQKRVSRTRALSLEKLGQWRNDYRAVLGEMLATWPPEVGAAYEAEIIDFALPNEACVVVFGCLEMWHIPALLELNLNEHGSETVLAGWWRRLAKRWGLRPFLIAEDVIWFKVDELPEERRRELFLADLLTFSSDVAECFEPSMIRSAGTDQKYLFPVPLQLTFKEE